MIFILEKSQDFLLYLSNYSNEKQVAYIKLFARPFCIDWVI